MSKLSRLAFHASAVAILIGGMALAPSSFAANANSLPSRTDSSAIVVSQSDSDMDNSTDNAAPAPQAKGKAAHHDMKMSPEMMKEHVENRIKTLHDKLMITPDQESQWSAVAQAMRDNESQIGDLIKQRHESAGNLTAVEDLQSYQAIAQAHADGLKNVIAAFGALYNGMSDDQKKNADTVFGTYEGHEAPHHGKSSNK